MVSLPSTLARVKVLGPKMDLVAGHDLEIPVKYRFIGHRKAVEWVAKKITEEEAKLSQKCIVMC